MDGASDVLRLGSLNDGENSRKSAARVVRRLIKAVQTNDRDFEQVEVDEPLMESSFVITNGAQSFTVTVIETGNGTPPLLMFLDKIPPRHMENVGCPSQYSGAEKEMRLARKWGA